MDTQPCGEEHTFLRLKAHPHLRGLRMQPMLGIRLLWPHFLLSRKQQPSGISHNFLLQNQPLHLRQRKQHSKDFLRKEFLTEAKISTKKKRLATGDKESNYSNQTGLQQHFRDQQQLFWQNLSWIRGTSFYQMHVFIHIDQCICINNGGATKKGWVKASYRGSLVQKSFPWSFLVCNSDLLREALMQSTPINKNKGKEGTGHQHSLTHIHTPSFKN